MLRNIDYEDLVRTISAHQSERIVGEESDRNEGKAKVTDYWEKCA